jgi:hypothetical protein
MGTRIEEMVCLRHGLISWSHELFLSTMNGKAFISIIAIPVFSTSIFRYF